MIKMLSRIKDGCSAKRFILPPTAAECHLREGALRLLTARSFLCIARRTLSSPILAFNPILFLPAEPPSSLQNTDLLRWRSPIQAPCVWGHIDRPAQHNFS